MKKKVGIIKKGVRYISDSSYRFKINDKFGIYDCLTDKKYLKKKFKAYLGYQLDLDNPKTFNEKIQWLKLYDRKPEYTMMVDKYLVRGYVASKIGEEYLIPLLGVWDSPEEIDFDKLPNQFVLKCNHNSGTGMCICRDKAKLDIKKVKRELSIGLSQNYYKLGREWPYKNVPRKIIAEKYMVSNSNDDLPDYKFMCFDGKVKCSFTCTERHKDSGLKVTFFDTRWNVMPFERHYPMSQKPLKKPLNYEKMVELAEKLSKGIPFARIDLYDINNRIYFGEITFHPGSGIEEFKPEDWDKTIGEWIQLPMKRVTVRK